MGAVENFGAVSRRPPDFEDYVDMLRRHRSWIIGPTYAGLVIAVVVAFLWPDTFESTAVMRIQPQVVSERMVPDTLDLQMAPRIEGLRTKILSRGFITGLINNKSLNLYPRLVQHYTTEDAMAQMSKDVTVAPYGVAAGTGRGQNAFFIRFRYPDKYKAKQVVDRLTTEFMSQNITLQTQSATETRNFIGEQLKGAKDKLDAIQANIAKFREANVGRLPESATLNVQRLQSFENQIMAYDDRISALQMQKNQLTDTLQSEINMLGFINAANEENAPAQSRADQSLTNLDRQISIEESTLAALRQTYRDDFPNVKSQQARIESLKREREQQQAVQDEQQRALKPEDSKKGLTVRQLASQQLQKDRIKQIQTQLDNIDLQVRRATDDKAKSQKAKEAVQREIQASPLIDQQYAALTQDLNLAKASYDDLAKKESMSQTVQDIQARNVGEQLEVLDTASLPMIPVDPNRWLISGVGVGLGLMLGLVMAGAKEAKDSSLKNLKDVRMYTNLPVLSSIPLLENALLVRRKRRLFWLAWSAAIIVGSAAMFISVAYYFTPKTQ